MNAEDIIAEVKTLTDDKELAQIWVELQNHRKWLAEEAREPARLAAMYEASVKWPIGTQVKIKNTGYRTLDGQVGAIDHLVYPQRGAYGGNTCQVAIWLGKKRSSPKYYTADGFVVIGLDRIEEIVT